MKKYRLLKNTSYALKGTIYQKEQRGNFDCYISLDHKNTIKAHGYPVEFVEGTDWFEEVKEITLEEQIKFIENNWSHGGKNLPIYLSILESLKTLQTICKIKQ